MITQYLKQANKVLIKYRYYTLINIFGLVCGMLAVLIIGKYIGYSIQYDRFHDKKDRIYSLAQKESTDGGVEQDHRVTYFGSGELLQQLPEVDRITRYSTHVPAAVIGGKVAGEKASFVESNIFTTDSSFLKTFSFPLIYGDASNALAKPNSLVLTQSASRRYFGNENPIGQTLTIRVSWGKETTYEITGVLEDITKHSRFQFDFLVNPQSVMDQDRYWEIPTYSTFILLKENVNEMQVQSKLRRLFDNVPQLKSDNRSLVVSINPLNSLQLSSTEYLLAAVGLFIAIICWTNYINQVIAQSYWRFKEVGVKKFLGATRQDLRNQFLIESTLHCVLSLILVIAIYLSLESSLQTLTDGHSLPLIGDASVINYLFLGIFLLGLIISGLIPSAILHSQKFDWSSQNLLNQKIGGLGVRKGLIMLQFSISLVLLICILAINNQLDYLESSDKGINMSNVLVIKAPYAKDTTWQEKSRRSKVFKSACAELPFVTDVALSTVVPGEEYRNETFLSLEGESNKFMVHQVGADEDYFDLYKVKFLVGGGFIPGAGFQNSSSIVLNESAAKGLGISLNDDAVDTKIYDQQSDRVFNLIGIIQDFHQTPLKYELAPIAFKFNRTRGHVSIKLNSNVLDDRVFNDGIDQLKQTWSALYNDASFDYYFLDSRYEAINLEDRYYSKFFNLFTILSIVISCLGLFGMSLTVSKRRQREVGIRKVHGASTTSILTIIFKGYLVTLLVAVIIGIPVGYWLVQIWLKEYAYRDQVGIGLIMAAIISLAAVFIMTVSYQTVKSAHTNPVKVLRE